MLVFTLCLLLSSAAKADVISSPFTDRGAAFSLEGAAGLEKPFTKHNSAAITGAVGALSMANKLQDVAVKGQVALEVRHYFKKNTFDGFNLGLNTALAYMRYPAYHLEQKHVTDDVGIVPGFRLSYSKQLNASFRLEPYLQAMPISFEMVDVFDWLNGNEGDFILTVGVRIGFNKLLIKESGE